LLLYLKAQTNGSRQYVSLKLKGTRGIDSLLAAESTGLLVDTWGWDTSFKV